MSVCVSTSDSAFQFLDGCSPEGIMARSPPSQTQTSAHRHAHRTVRSSPAAPQGPLIICGRGGAAGRQRCRAGWRSSTLIKVKLIRRHIEWFCEVGSSRLSCLCILSLIWSISQPLPHLVCYLFTQSATHLLSCRSFTFSPCNNKQAIQ